MNNKGQTILTVGFVLLVGFVVWMFLAPTINEFGHQAAVLSETGFEAFLWDNLNLWIFFGMLAFTTIGIYIVGGGQ